MSLAPGTHVGAYEVLAPVGAGGMGEVYRARDTRLDRDVALKILPDLFARDPERLARFEREAKTLAALNHPHIAHIHGVEDTGTGRALVMEFVDGEDLSQSIARGPLPLDDAVAIARQIAGALEAAHEQGIIHRDLKPANIKVRPDGTVKVLDFGLAKALESGTSGSGQAGGAGGESWMDSPTITSPAMTQKGVILGTAAYMAPEQARGKSVDKRADIWAFGVVLYELVTGKRPFQGEDVPDTLAQVLTTEPDIARAPRQVQKLLRRCLEKDPKKRLRDIGEAPFLIDTESEAPPPSRRDPVIWLAVGLGVLFFAAAATLALLHFGETSAARARVQFQIAPPEGRTFSSISLSPDGRKLAFVAYDQNNRASVWVHWLESGESRQLVAASAGNSPFWSPDSSTIGFIAENRVRKIAVSGGLAQTICDLPPAAGVGRRRLEQRRYHPVWQPVWSALRCPGARWTGDPDNCTGCDAAGNWPHRSVVSSRRAPFRLHAALEKR